MASPAVNPLSAASLIPYMESSLPESSNAALRNPYDAIALLSHACMISVGFRLIGLGEDHKIEAHSEAGDSRPLPPEWNASSSYSFRYVHPQSSMEYLVKVTRLGSKAVVLGLGVGDDKTASFDIIVKEYIFESSLPFQRRGGASSSSIQNVFISPGRIADLAALFKIKIMQRIIPALHKEGYEETRTSNEDEAASGSSRRQAGDRRGRYDQENDDHRPYPRNDGIPPPARPYPYHEDPLTGLPRRPPPPPHPAGDFPPPGFEDEYEMRGPAIPRPGFGGAGARNPLEIGHDDLYPPGLGPHDPLRGSFLPGGGLPRPGGGGGGMHPTFDDPLFGGGAGGFDPNRPPGARYDPIGPGDGPPYGGGGDFRRSPFPGAGGYPRTGGGGPGNPFGGFGGGGGGGII